MSTETDTTIEAPPGAGLTNMASELEKLLTPIAAGAEAATKTAEKTDAKPGDKGAEAAKGTVATENKDTTATAEKATADAKLLELEDAKGLSPKATEKFNALKTSRDTERTAKTKLEEQLRTLQTELESQKKLVPAQSDELDQIKRERDELSKIVQLQAVERHPRFKAYFENKISEATAAAKAAAGPQFAERVVEIVKMTDGTAKDEAVEALLSELPPYRATQVGTALYEFQKIHQERQGEIAKASENFTKLEQQTALQQKEQQQKVEATRNGFLEAARKAAAGLDGFKTIEGNPEHNAKVNGRLQFIDDFMHLRLNEKVVPMIPVLFGQALHLMDSILPARDARIAALEKQIADLSKATPGANSGDAGGAKGGGAEGGPKTDDFKATFKHYMGQLGGGGQ
jgi:hypothetical protein